MHNFTHEITYKIRTLRKLRKANVQFQPDKCEFLRKEEEEDISDILLANMVFDRIRKRYMPSKNFQDHKIINTLNNFLV